MGMCVCMCTVSVSIYTRTFHCLPARPPAWLASCCPAVWLFVCMELLDSGGLSLKPVVSSVVSMSSIRSLPPPMGCTRGRGRERERTQAKAEPRSWKKMPWQDWRWSLDCSKFWKVRPIVGEHERELLREGQPVLRCTMGFVIKAVFGNEDGTVSLQSRQGPCLSVRCSGH